MLLLSFLAFAFSRLQYSVFGQQQVNVDQTYQMLGGRQTLQNLPMMQIETKGDYYEPQESGHDFSMVNTMTYNMNKTTDQARNMVRLDMKLRVFFPFHLTDGWATIVISGNEGYREGVYNYFAQPDLTPIQEALESAYLMAVLKTELMANPLALMQMNLQGKGRPSVGHIKFQMINDCSDCPDINLWINQTTGLPSRAQTMEGDWINGDVVFQIDYENWTNFGGMMFPRKLTYRHHGDVIRREEVRNVRFMSDTGSNSFSQPQQPNQNNLFNSNQFEFNNNNNQINRSLFNQPFGQNNNQFGQNNNQFGQNSNQFGQNNNQFGPNNNPFGQNSNQFGQNSFLFGQSTMQQFQPSSSQNQQALFQLKTRKPYDAQYAIRGYKTAQWFNRGFALGEPLDQKLTGGQLEVVGDRLYKIDVGQGGYYSVIWDTPEGLYVVDVGLNADRSDYVVQILGQRFPGKRILGIVITHMHYDHVGGLRAMAARADKVYVGLPSAQYVKDILYRKPSTILPDELSQNGRQDIEVVPVYDRLRLSNDPYAFELIRFKNIGHSIDYIGTYFPAHKLIVVADILNGGQYDSLLRKSAPPSQREIITRAKQFTQEIVLAGIDVTTVLTIHGGEVPLSELKKMAGNTYENLFN